MQAVLIIINKTFREDMTSQQLYDATRSSWKIKKGARAAPYVLAVAHRKIREIYRVREWHQAGYERWEFSGEVAEESVRRRYIGKRTQRQYGNPVRPLPDVDAFLEEPDNSVLLNGGVMIENAFALLRQFGQIIFTGPPGTGKTRAAKLLLPELLGVSESELEKHRGVRGPHARWDIVQFHPSYNYEDFVRGVQVETQQGKVAYKTVNRIFGEMCERASQFPNSYHALIIDEINRANVSAVLGELIYALEYRGEAVKTPYKGEYGGKIENDIVVPENLYIIGTMNTADRTIGQIDYAVRRRFAFVHLAPNPEIVADGKPREFFYRVDALFNGEYMSPDFEADDLRIGHSYFLADTEREIPPQQQIANKIIWQVVPILREYVRDGVLAKDAEKEIAAIEEDAKKLLAGESEDSSADEEERGGKWYFYWRNGERYGVGGVAHTGVSVIQVFAAQHPDMDAAALGQEFSFLDLESRKRVILQEDAPERGGIKRYFDDRPIPLQSGETVLVSANWGVKDGLLKQWDAFKERMSAHGYSINRCRLVNFGEGESRQWDCARKYNFIAAGGDQAYYTGMETFKKGDLIFVLLAEQGENNGCIACGEVAEKAAGVYDFITEDGPLVDVDVGGEKYADKFSRACEREFPDLVVRMKWLPGIKERGEVVRVRGSARKLWRGKILSEDFKNLRAAFNLPGYDK